jgi:hypothetical protein
MVTPVVAAPLSTVEKVVAFITKYTLLELGAIMLRIAVRAPVQSKMAERAWSAA